MLGHRYFSVLILFILFSSHPAQGARVIKDLYQASRIISVNANQSELNDAMSDGMEEVIVRISGYSTAVLNSEIQNQLSKSSNYLSSFRYESSAETRTNVLGEVVRTKRLVMVFNAKRIENLLIDASKPVWDANRPAVLTFIAVENGNRRELLSRLDSHDLLEAFKIASIDRGIPYELPAMDFIDELAISASEVWGLFTDTIKSAAERYDNEYVLAGRIYSTTSDQWTGDWLLLSDQNGIRFQTKSESQVELIEQTVSLIAEQMADRFAMKLDGRAKNQIVITLQGIQSLKDYSDALELLNGLAVIKEAKVESVDGSLVTFHIASYGDERQVLDILGLNRSHFESVIIDEPVDGEIEKNRGILLQWVP